MKNGFLNELNDDGIDRILDVFRRDAGLFVLFFDPVRWRLSARRGGCDGVSESRRDCTGWARSASGRTAEGAEAKIAKMRAAWKELEPLTKGFYTNLADADEPLAAYRENYGANFERLVALKAKYDPMNLFRLNANVPPKA